MKTILIAISALALSACGTMNAFTSAALTTGTADYAAAKKNLQTIDDAKLQAWLDSACSTNVGALQRASATGNAHVANAVFTACPVSNVGVTSILPSGNMQVQTVAIQPAPVK